MRLNFVYRLGVLFAASWLVLNPAWSNERLLELLNKRADSEVGRTFLSALEKSDALQPLADRLLKEGAKRPELGLRLFNALCEYARNDAAEPKKRAAILSAFGLKIQVHTPQSIRLVSFEVVQTPWENERPLGVEIARPEWRTMLSALNDYNFKQLVQGQRLLNLELSLPELERGKLSRRVFLTLRGDRFEVTFVGLGTEFTKMIPLDQVPSLFRLIAATTYGTHIPQEDLTIQARRFMKEVPVLPALFTLGIFNPDHPQAEGEFLKLLKAPLPEGEALRTLGWNGLMSKKVFSPRATAVVIETARESDQQRSLGAISLLSRMPDAGLQAQQALYELYDHPNQERRSAARHALGTIAWETGALHEQIIGELVARLFGEKPSEFHPGHILDGLKPFPPALAKELAEKLEHQPRHPFRALIERTLNRAYCEAQLTLN